MSIPLKLRDWIDPEKLDWNYLSLNPSEGAIALLEQKPDKICWTLLSQTPAAIRLLEQNTDKIDWVHLSKNQAAIRLLEQNRMLKVDISLYIIN
jgi:hypothetical protein